MRLPLFQSGLSFFLFFSACSNVNLIATDSKTIQEHLSRLGVETERRSEQIGPLLIPEFFQRKRIEEGLRKSHEDLQERVQQRKAELQKTKDRYETLDNSIDGIV